MKTTASPTIPKRICEGTRAISSVSTASIVALRIIRMPMMTSKAVVPSRIKSKSRQIETRDCIPLSLTQPTQGGNAAHYSAACHVRQPEQPRMNSAKTQTRSDQAARGIQDRKSTRLNSSHVKISYAVFCLKKKRAHLQVRPADAAPDA